MFNFLITHSPLLYFTQSLWRDEAFSILVAQKPLSFIFGKLAVEPPLYYVLLHFWIKLFGDGEVAARSLSLVGFACATIIVIHWAEKLFKKHWLSWFLPVFFFLNPMLLYYAFEVRLYGWYVFFATLSLFAYIEKKWVLLTAANVLGFYTHSYMILVPLIQVVHWVATQKRLRGKKIYLDPVVRSFTALLLFAAPWFWNMASQVTKFRHSWYYPVDLNLVTSVVGNLFVGYDGTPGYLWGATKLVSVIMLVFSVFALKNRASYRRNLFFFLIMIVPLAGVVGISVFKPLFVNRYVIPVAIGEVFLVVFALEAVRSKTTQKLLAAGLLLSVIGWNVWYPSKHAKLDIRATVREVQTLKGKEDVILVDSPLILFETIYYAKGSQVFLYNPNNSPFPWYVGDVLVTPGRMVRDVPLYPMRAFVIHDDGTFTVAYQTP